MKKTKDKVKTDWSFNEALEIYNRPFNDLFIKHRQFIVKILKIIKFK